jgi:hypothetical protein
MRVARTCGIVLGLLLSGSWALVADPIGTANYIAGCYTTAFGQTVADCTDQTDAFKVGFSTPSQSSYSGVFSVDGGAGVGTTTASAYASGGFLKGSSYVTITSASIITSTEEDAATVMEDTITISDPSLNGTDGSLVLGMSIDATGNGGVTVAPGVVTGSGVAIYAGGGVSGFPTAETSFFTSSTLDTSYTGPSTSFVFGQPFSIELYFETIAGVFCTDTTACASYNSGGPVFLDANDTAILDSLTVFNAAGGVVSSADWTVASEGGVNYTADGVVPEPSSYALLGLCLGVLALAGWRRREKERPGQSL